MTRKDFENELIARLEDIRALYKKYNPEAFEPTLEEDNGVYLSMTISGDHISAFNSYFNVESADHHHVVNCWKTDGMGITHMDLTE